MGETILALAAKSKQDLKPEGRRRRDGGRAEDEKGALAAFDLHTRRSPHFVWLEARRPAHRAVHSAFRARPPSPPSPGAKNLTRQLSSHQQAHRHNLTMHPTLSLELQLLILRFPLLPITLRSAPERQRLSRVLMLVNRDWARETQRLMVDPLLIAPTSTSAADEQMKDARMSGWDGRRIHVDMSSWRVGDVLGLTGVHELYLGVAGGRNFSSLHVVGSNQQAVPRLRHIIQNQVILTHVHLANVKLESSHLRDFLSLPSLCNFLLTGVILRGLGRHWQQRLRRLDTADPSAWNGRTLTAASGLRRLALYNCDPQVNLDFFYSLPPLLEHLAYLPERTTSFGRHPSAPPRPTLFPASLRTLTYFTAGATEPAALALFRRGCAEVGARFECDRRRTAFASWDAELWAAASET
ncbi:Proteophosphoglycan ppg4 [Rhodotorula toruloides]|nr:Proteophosphoglycan ppg4 [Rhodotorula toruloides]